MAFADGRDARLPKPGPGHLMRVHIWIEADTLDVCAYLADTSRAVQERISPIYASNAFGEMLRLEIDRRFPPASGQHDPSPRRGEVQYGERGEMDRSGATPGCGG